MSKIGTEILVNTQTLYDQTLAETAKLNNEGFVTVWVDWADNVKPAVADGSWSGIKTQMFLADGTKVGHEILVNTATVNWQQDPHVAVLTGGNFVVTWTDGWDYFAYADHPGSQGVGGAASDKQGKAIKAQVFSANGAFVGNEVLVNTETRMDQTAEKVMALANGNFVVAWEDWSISCIYDATGGAIQCGGGAGIRLQLFGPTGSKIGAEMAVTGQHNYQPQIATLANGGYVVAWHDGHYSVDDVRAQVFSATGAKVGAEILVNSTGSGPTFSSQSEEQVAGLSNGGFVVTWTDGNGDDSSRGVKAQVFGASGEFVGTEILVNTTTFSNQLHAKVVPLKNGGFVVVWDDWSSDIDVRAQVFDNKGVRIGTEILANATKDGAQDGARIAPTDDGGFVVSWAENWRDVKLQAFDAKGLKVGTEVLANTTTAGGQSAAQLTSLDHGGFVVAWNDDLYGPSDGSGSAVKAQVFAIDQTIVGTSGSDLIIGGVGNDSFRGLGGNDGIDGSAGIDAVLYGDIRSTYTLAKGGTGWTVSSPMHSTDKLTNIERLQFSNSKLALDLGSTEHAGLALEFIGLMAPPLIQTPSVVGMILGLFDSGSSMLDVCQLALDVGLVKSIAGSDTKAALAAMAFRNVIGAEADAAVIDMLVGYMDGRNASYSQADFMAVIAGLEVNQTHIGLVGLQQTGVEYM